MNRIVGIISIIFVILILFSFVSRFLNFFDGPGDLERLVWIRRVLNDSEATREIYKVRDPYQILVKCIGKSEMFKNGKVYDSLDNEIKLEYSRKKVGWIIHYYGKNGVDDNGYNDDLVWFRKRKARGDFAIRLVKTMKELKAVEPTLRVAMEMINQSKKLLAVSKQEKSIDKCDEAYSILQKIRIGKDNKSLIPEMVLLDDQIGKYVDILSRRNTDGIVKASKLISEINMVMLPIQKGTFQMGSDEGSYSEKPVHSVTISKDFWIGQIEVTQHQYGRIMATNPSVFKGGTLPVDNVCWENAVKFCTKLTDLAVKAGTLPHGYVYRLPTEAEWEYCCQPIITNEGIRGLEKVAWFFENSGDSIVTRKDWDGGNVIVKNKCRPHPVGTKRPNAWGLYDMRGNVSEWCFDSYLKGYYSTSATIDPIPVTKHNAFDPFCRVVRGGSYRSHSKDCNPFSRADLPQFKYMGTGFRIVLAPILIPSIITLREYE